MSSSRAKKRLKQTEDIINNTTYYDPHPNPKTDKSRQSKKKRFEELAEAIKFKLKL